MRTWGGAEVWFLDTALALSRRGHRVSIVAQPDGELAHRARTEDVAVRELAIRFDAAPWTLAKLARYFAGSGVTAVVANLTKDLKAAAVAGRIAGVPVVLASRESDFPLKDKFYYRWYFNRLATGLLVNSQATRATVLASVPWLDPGRVHLLYKGIDCQRFTPGRSAPSVPTVGFVGQLIERKGLLELMAAWSLIESRDLVAPPVLRIAGTGPLADQLAAWRRGLRRPDLVHLEGFVEDIPAFYRGLDLLVMPSRAEGFGLAAAEAQACGLPVIGTRASSLPEIVLDGRTGLLVPPESAGDLATAVIKLLKDPAWARTLGAAGHERVLAEFTSERTCDRLLRLTGAPAAPSPKGMQS